MYHDELLNRLIGKKVTHIYMNEACLKFSTDEGDIAFGVEGDCCSKSVFYDFYGVKKLLQNGKIKSVREIELTDDDKDRKSQYSDDCIQIYGVEMVTEDKEFGDVTSVFSFRNYSNGYYGGNLTNADPNQEVRPEISDDLVETEEAK